MGVKTWKSVRWVRKESLADLWPFDLLHYMQIDSVGWMFGKVTFGVISCVAKFEIEDALLLHATYVINVLKCGNFSGDKATTTVRMCGKDIKWVFVKIIYN